MYVLRTLGTFSLLVLTACTPAVVNPTFKPTQPVSRWVHGEGFVEELREGVRVAVAHRRSSVGAIEFTVDIENQSTVPLEIRPEAFQCRLSEAWSGRPDVQVVKAQDPEARLRQLEAAKAAEKKAQSDASAFQGIFFLLDIADTVSNTGKRSREENRRISEEKAKTYDRVERDKKNAEEREESLASQQRERERVALRKHTLEPGQRLQGRVEFHLNASEHRKLHLEVPVGDRLFAFEFMPGL